MSGENCCPRCGSTMPGSEWSRESGPGWQAVHGDGIRMLLGLDPGSVDAVITDPPYGSGGFSVRDRQRSAKSKYVASNAVYSRDLPEFDGEAQHPAAWEEMIRRALAATRQALVPGGHLLIFIDWRNAPVMAHLVAASGLTWRNTLAWNKGRGSRPYAGGFRLQAEFILWATNGARRSPYPGQPYLDGVFEAGTRTNGKRHITEKPLALMDALMPICPPEGLVVDPFQGSGTTGVSAVHAGRRYIGAESVDGYHRIAVERLRAAVEEAGS